MLFKPKRSDGRSYRDVALDKLKEMKPGQIISYEELGRHLGTPNIRTIQHAVRKANKDLLKHHQRGIVAVANQGYRCLPARENMIVANNHQNKADRAMIRAEQFFDGTNLSEMTKAERKLHQGQAMLCKALIASHKSLDRRIRRLEDVLYPPEGKVLDLQKN